ncbi:phage terminase large subunit [Nitrobacter sp. JJSN]|uniref:phage terminase large subunit n=1 Tax=Nitrobacter sp. JJSN TaxID=3453033 RepID=UPI003F76FFE5
MLIAADFARAVDPVLMARDAGIECDPWQADLLRVNPKRALLLCSRQSGKTTVTALMALHRAIYETGALVVIVSPSNRQSGEMLRQIKKLHGSLNGAPELVGDSVLKIEMTNGSRILALPGTSATIRGIAGVSLVVVDEASRVEDDLMAAVRPMLATRSDGSLIALTTPAGKRGWFFDAWHGDNEWHRVRVSASDCPRISKEFLADELKNLGPARYSEEYELAFVDSAENAFPTAVIERAFTTEVEPLWA